ncbi:helix-turn-helix transcriptional regulator [Pseudomonas graminis]|uniref:AlpA family transcriptional regulator n=1 Tax=Pseudomonas graminis TaxID=158627 RepID=A0A1C2DY80_9PSED|nr:AlpA family phage regulatory protein [Pseudomonas graminis]OCX19593.1 AlpA family transcriptional regulator [Pseudomonas graminis]
MLIQKRVAKVVDDRSDADVIEFIRLPEVKRLTGLSTATIYRMVTAGVFPRQVKIGAQAVGWVKEEVLVWSQAKVQASRE